MRRGRNEINCKSGIDCNECKTPCLSNIEPKYPHFLNKYDLVAFQSDRLLNPREISYGILGTGMDKCDFDSYVIELENEFIIDRKIDYKVEIRQDKER